MNTLFNQMRSAIADLENNENAPHASNFLQIAVQILDAQSALTVDFVNTAQHDKVLADSMLKSLTRAAHAFSCDCSQSIADRDELMEVSAKSLGLSPVEDGEGVYDFIAELKKKYGDKIEFMTIADFEKLLSNGDVNVKFS